MKKSIMFLILLLVLVFVFTTAGCSQTDLTPEKTSDADLEDIDSDESVTVVDQLGRKVSLAGLPQKIISLSPSNTEIAFALGLADQLVGVTEYCNYPPEVLEKEIIGGFATPNIERIVELEPDLILASTIHEETVTQFDALGIPVLVIESANLEELFTSITLVAELTGVSGRGESLISSMQQRIGAIEEIVAQIEDDEKIRVYYEVYSDPLMSAGNSVFINEIIKLAGGINIFEDIDENYPQISAEVVAERQPQVILYPDYHGTADLVLESMTLRPGWESVTAVIEGRVFAISDDAFARPGPRVVIAVEEAARLFYPELFNDSSCNCCD
jgi:iron complex transport system substrate-binding protein